MRKQNYYVYGDVLRDHLDDRPLLLRRKVFQSPGVPKMGGRTLVLQVPVLQLHDQSMGDRDNKRLRYVSRCRILILEHLHEAVPRKQQCFVLRIARSPSTRSCPSTVPADHENAGAQDRR